MTGELNAPCAGAVKRASGLLPAVRLKPSSLPDHERVVLTQRLKGVAPSGSIPSFSRMLKARRWEGETCMITLFDMEVNVVHKAAPGEVLPFNTKPQDTVEAAARQLERGAS